MHKLVATWIILVMLMTAYLLIAPNKHQSPTLPQITIYEIPSKSNITDEKTNENNAPVLPIEQPKEQIAQRKVEVLATKPLPPKTIKPRNIGKTLKIEFYGPTWVQEIYSTESKMEKYDSGDTITFPIKNLDGIVISSSKFAKAYLNDMPIDLDSFHGDQGGDSVWFTNDDLSRMTKVDLQNIKPK